MEFTEEEKNILMNIAHYHDDITITRIKDDELMA